MRIFSLLASAAFLITSAVAQTTPVLKIKDGDWPMFSRDLAGTRYSPLVQINTKNVAKLGKAWSYSLRSPAGPPGTPAPPSPTSEITPIVVDGVMYLTAGNRVVALEPETGKEKWTYTPPGNGLSRRAVAYWPGDRNNPPRIIFTVLLSAAT